MKEIVIKYLFVDIYIYIHLCLITHVNVHVYIPTLIFRRFALKNYPYAISALGSCTAAYINAHYRKAVRLRHNAFVSSLIPVVVLPPLVGTLLHHHVSISGCCLLNHEIKPWIEKSLSRMIVSVVDYCQDNHIEIY